MHSSTRDARQPFTVLLPDGPRKPLEIHDNEVGLVMALVDKASVQALGEDWNSVGVYILLGPVAADGSYNVYVGKSPMGLRNRLMEHGRSRTWTRGLLIRRVVLHGFTSSHAGWLEGDLYDLFSTAQLAAVENVQTPRDDTVPPYELRMLRSLRDPIIRVLRMLGYETESAPETVEAPADIAAETPTEQPAAQVVAKRRSRTAYNVSIADLMASGLLGAGERLSSTSNAWPATATVNADATITWNDKRYPSASAAASAVCEGTPVNGWDFWATESDGGATRLSTLRKRHLDNVTPPQTETEWVPPAGEVLAARHVSLRSARSRKPRTEFNVTISDLLEAGLLRGGDRLTSAAPDLRAEALIGYDGTITVGKDMFQTPSTAAQAVKGDRNTNGWHFWNLQGPHGDVSLDDLRREHLGILKQPSGRGAPARYEVELTNLLDAGLVQAGDLLVSTSRAWPAVAYIDPAGCVVFDGATHSSLSTAASAVRLGRSTNGWDFWALERDGSAVRMTDVRAAYISAGEDIDNDA